MDEDYFKEGMENILQELALLAISIKVSEYISPEKFGELMAIADTSFDGTEEQDELTKKIDKIVNVMYLGIGEPEELTKEEIEVWLLSLLKSAVEESQ